MRRALAVACRSAVVVAISAVLVATSMSPVVAADLPVPPAGLVPAVPSTGADAPSSSVPSGDFSAPVLPAVGDVQQGKGVPAVLQRPLSAAAVGGLDPNAAKVVGRDEWSTRYRTAGGVDFSVVGFLPLNAEVAGSWVPVSGSVSKMTDGGWSADRNPLHPVFAARSGSSVLSVSRGGYNVEFSLDGASSSAVSVSSPRASLSSTVTYRDVAGTVDLQYTVLPSQVKETLVVPTVPSVSDSTWSWSIAADGLTVVKDEFGNIVFRDGAGVAQITIPSPVMWDSSGVAGVREPALTGVGTSVQLEPSGLWRLTLSADPAWLADPARVYPVYVDPTVTPGADSIHSYKSDGTTNNGTVWIGNTRQSNRNVYWRTVDHYNYEQLFGKQVIGAQLNSSYAGSGTTNCYGGYVHWATAFNYNGVGETLTAAWRIHRRVRLLLSCRCHLGSRRIGNGCGTAALWIVATFLLIRAKRARLAELRASENSLKPSRDE